MRKIKYATLQECMNAFLRRPADESIDIEGVWVSSTGDATMQEVIAKHTDMGCWGWCENKEIIHLWIDENADILNVICLIAHEIGHTMRPWHNNQISEESKACGYGDVAKNALMLML